MNLGQLLCSQDANSYLACGALSMFNQMLHSNRVCLNDKLLIELNSLPVNTEAAAVPMQIC